MKTVMTVLTIALLLTILYIAVRVLLVAIIYHADKIKREKTL